MGFLKKKKKLDKIKNNKPILIQEKLTNKFAAIYMSNLKNTQYPAKEQLVLAKDKVEISLTEELCNEEVINSLSIDLQDDVNSKGKISFDLLKLDFYNWLEKHPLKIPEPAKTTELINWRAALTALIGTILGGYLLPLFFLLIMNKADASRLGMIIGGPLGAGLIIFFHCYISKNRKIKSAFLIGLGLVTVADIFFTAKAASGLGGLWRSLKGKNKGFSPFLKRIFSYFIILIILVLAKRKVIFDQEDYRKIVDNSIYLWLTGSFEFIQNWLRQPSKDEDQNDKSMNDLIECIYKIHQSPKEYLVDVASEMIVTAKNLGIEGIEGEPVFISDKFIKPDEFEWNDDSEKTYNAFGVIEEGDKVYIEKKAIIKDGIVIKKGIARKIRRR